MGTRGLCPGAPCAWGPRDNLALSSATKGSQEMRQQHHSQLLSAERRGSTAALTSLKKCDQAEADNRYFL